MKNGGVKLLEDEEQEKLFNWVNVYKRYHPELEMLFHIPNGGLRNKQVAIKLKRQGVKAGVSDLFLSVPKGTYHGLYIEMKIKGNKPTEKQEEWFRLVHQYGYGFITCYGCEAAQRALLSYLSLGDYQNNKK